MGERRILVVDEDRLLLGSISRVLARSVIVHTAVSATEAGEVLAAGQRLDAVIVAASLGHDGHKVFRRARALHPEAWRVATTGRGGDRLCQAIDAALVVAEAA